MIPVSVLCYKVHHKGGKKMKNLFKSLLVASLMTGLVSTASAADYVLKYGHVGPVTSDDQVPGEFLKSL